MEDILHYVWKHRLFQKNLKTTDGTPFEVIDTGTYNTSDGPDFFNAKIKINNKVWAGNVEIHKKSSDWEKHRHHLDKTYNSVILHIVENADVQVCSESGETIPQCEVVYPSYIKSNIEYLLYSDIHTPCANYLKDVPDVHIGGWLNTLLVERLERKSNDIFRWLEKYNNSWDEVFYILLSRSFGFGLNSDFFEQLALSIPYSAIQKQRNNIQQIEAMLFGQAGLLENIEKYDDYSLLLNREYRLLKQKYHLQALTKGQKLKMRLRPGSQPYIRIAQLAALLHKEDKLFSKVVNCNEVGKIRLMLHENASEYWQTHYTLGLESPKKNKYIGDQSLDVLIINAIAPILFSYGKYIANENLCERALDFLEKIKPESNSIVKSFKSTGVEIKSAYDSQAVIQLKREYCEKRKCLFCRIGYFILSNP